MYAIKVAKLLITRKVPSFIHSFVSWLLECKDFTETINITISNYKVNDAHISKLENCEL